MISWHGVVMPIWNHRFLVSKNLWLNDLRWWYYEMSHIVSKSHYLISSRTECTRSPVWKLPRSQSFETLVPQIHIWIHEPYKFIYETSIWNHSLYELTYEFIRMNPYKLWFHIFISYIRMNPYKLWFHILISYMNS